MSAQKPSPKDGTKFKKLAIDPSPAELSDIHLDGEIDEDVKIYDTCDDVRKKVNEHLKTSSQAAFARELSEMLPVTKINASHVSRFVKMKGPMAGGHNPVFYGAYLYFEKLRIKQGKKKSAKREKMEDHWASQGGFPREGSHNTYLTCRTGESWKIDALGRLQIKGTPSGGFTRKKATKN
jgi:hypothetical protein